MKKALCLLLSALSLPLCAATNAISMLPVVTNTTPNDRLPVSVWTGSNYVSRQIAVSNLVPVSAGGGVPAEWNAAFASDGSTNQIGSGAVSDGQSLSVGYLANSSLWGIALGSLAYAVNAGVSIGYNSLGDNFNIAIGYAAIANDIGTFTYTTEIGQGVATLNGGLHYRGNVICDGDGVVLVKSPSGCFWHLAVTDDGTLYATNAMTADGQACSAP